MRRPWKELPASNGCDKSSRSRDTIRQHQDTSVWGPPATVAVRGPAGARIDEFPMNERLHMSRHEDAVW